MELKVKDKVKLPFNEEGIIEKINTTSIDYFPYKVRITKATLSNGGEVIDFKKSQLKKLE